MRTHALGVCAVFCATCLPAYGEEPADYSTAAGHLIVVRISERIFEPIVGKNLDLTKQVNEVILGTPVRGQSRTRGKINVDISPDQDDASLVFTFHGQTNSKTVGRNGPATLYSRSTTNFECSNQVTFDLEAGFRAGKTTIRSTTNITTDDVKINRRGLRGLLMRKIAWKRVRENRPAARAEATQLARRDIVQGFDRRLAEQLDELNQRLAITELLTTLVGKATETEYSVSSTDKYIQLCIRRQGVPELPPQIPEQQVAGAPIEVWVHSSMMDQKVFNVMQIVAVIRNLAQPVAQAFVAQFPLVRNRLSSDLIFVNWRPFNARVFARPVAQYWRRGPGRMLIALDTANEWVFFGINDVAVVERRARDERNAVPVSAQR